jgi:hypothetical protein
MNLPCSRSRHSSLDGNGIDVLSHGGRIFTHFPSVFSFHLRSIETAAKLQGLVDLDDDEGVEDDNGDVGDDLHDDEFAPEGVQLFVERILSQCRLSHVRLVGVGEDVRFHLEKLKENYLFSV